MIRVVFNELSLAPLLTNRQHASEVFETFFNIIDEIGKLRIASVVRIVASREFYNENICQEYFSIKDWLSTIDQDRRMRYLGYYLQEQILLDNPEHHYNGTSCVGFGYAYENKTVSISFNTSVWSELEYVIERLYLSEEGEMQLESSMVSSQHCPSCRDVSIRKSLLQDYHDLDEEVMSSIISSIGDFWSKRESLFPNLIFTENVQNLLIDNYASLNNPNFKKAFHFLKKLQKHLEKVARGECEYGEIPADVSPESEATLNKYTESRTFVLPDTGERCIFSLHAKPGSSVRVHLFAKEQENKYYVGYIGPHLKTAKNK